MTRYELCQQFGLAYLYVAGNVSECFHADFASQSCDIGFIRFCGIYIGRVVVLVTIRAVAGTGISLCCSQADRHVLYKSMAHMVDKHIAQRQGERLQQAVPTLKAAKGKNLPRLAMQHDSLDAAGWCRNAQLC